MKILKPEFWLDYELIDSGNYRKLERFGKYILDRPEPQAIWDPHLSPQEWNKQADAVFIREGKNEQAERGEWKLKPDMPEQWRMSYVSKEMKITFRLGLSAFKHVGLFPEQAVNWEYISEKCRSLPVERPKVLNLFAYTGGASLAARAAGAEVYHVDSVKQVISWARENMEISGLDHIRWVVEDAMKFVEREARRGNRYHGIILDPPAYGRGPKGEKWLITEHLNRMIRCCKDLLDPENHFFILNLYSIGFSPLIQESLVSSVFGKVDNSEAGELYLEDQGKRKLPLGSFCRFSSL